MIFQGKDGELRITSYGYNGTTRYIKVLFCEMNYDGPLGKTRTEERLVMDRGIFDACSHMVEGNDEPRFNPAPLTFSCRLADTTHTQVLVDWLSGVTFTSLTGGCGAALSKESISSVIPEEIIGISRQTGSPFLVILILLIPLEVKRFSPSINSVIFLVSIL